jgi:hypothetical protein
MRVTAPLLASALLVLVLLPLSPAPSAALTQITVSAPSGIFPDADGFLLGDSDPYVEVRVDGTLIGTTSIIGGNNNPSWPGTSFTVQMNPLGAPLLTVELKAYDDDNGIPEYLGVATISYDWVTALPVTATATLTSPFAGSYSATATIEAAAVPVPSRASTWGRLKALYR